MNDATSLLLASCWPQPQPQPQRSSEFRRGWPAWAVAVAVAVAVVRGHEGRPRRRQVGERVECEWECEWTSRAGQGRAGQSTEGQSHRRCSLRRGAVQGKERPIARIAPPTSPWLHG